MPPQETPLTGGQSTAQVVRIGDAVHRTLSPRAAVVHPLLRYLESRSFPFSPRFLGIDAQGREILSYIRGEVPRDKPLTLTQKAEAFRMLRTYHDLAAEFGLNQGEETVCHHDFAPWNIIVADGKVTGMIDFDDAAPGRRIDDVVYAVWTFLDLGIAALPSHEQIAQMVRLLTAYGPLDRTQFVPALLGRQQAILAFRERMAREAPAAAMREFSTGAVERIRRSMEWVRDRESDINTALERVGC